MRERRRAASSAGRRPPTGLLAPLLLLVPLLLSSFSSVRGQGVERDPTPEEIKNATETLRRFPYVTSIRNAQGGHSCTGSLIFPHIVITAASCVDPRVSSQVVRNPQLLVGVHRTDVVDEDTTVRETVNVTTHPKWLGNVNDGHDVAAILLNQTVDSIIIDGKPRRVVLRIAPPGVRTPGSGFFIEDGQPLGLLSYGRLSQGSASSPLLNMAMMNFINNSQCNEPDMKDGEVGRSQLCAGETTGEPCQGDQGAPLVWLSMQGNLPTGDFLFGLVSIVNNPCGNGEPVIFSRLTAVRDWLFDFGCWTAPNDEVKALLCPVVEATQAAKQQEEEDEDGDKDGKEEDENGDKDGKEEDEDGGKDGKEEDENGDKDGKEEDEDGGKDEEEEDEEEDKDGNEEEEDGDEDEDMNREEEEINGVEEEINGEEDGGGK